MVFSIWLSLDKQEIHFHNYVRPCEVEKNRIETLRASYDNHTTILGLDSPQCSPDGYFQPVRKIGNSWDTRHNQHLSIQQLQHKYIPIFHIEYTASILWVEKSKIMKSLIRRRLPTAVNKFSNALKYFSYFHNLLNLRLRSLCQNEIFAAESTYFSTSMSCWWILQKLSMSWRSLFLCRSGNWWHGRR